MDSHEARQAAELFRRFQAHGDSEALTRVFDLVAPELMGLAGHLSRNLVEAEDLVQECFLIAIRRAPRWDPRRPLLPWLAGILLREARRWKRRAARRPDAERLRPPTPEEGSRRALAGELGRAIAAALEGLPPRYGEVLRAHLLDGQSPQAIAAHLGRAPGTVRVQLHRGLDLLRRALPAGLSLGALGVLQPRGMAAMRAVVQAEAIARGPVLVGAGGSGTLALSSLSLTGGMLMSVKSLVAVATLTMAGVGWMVTRSSSSPVRPGATPVLGTAMARVDALEALEPVASTEQRGPEGEEEEVRHLAVVSEAEAPPSEVLPTGVLLRGTVHGGEGSYELEVSVGNVDRRTLTRTLEAGPYEVALTDLLQGESPEDLSVLAIVRAKGHIPSSAWATRATDEEGAVYEADLTPKRILRVLRGRLVDPEGEPLAGWVGFLPEEMATPRPYETIPSEKVGEDGRFEFSLTDAVPGSLALTADGFATGGVVIDADMRGVRDLGDVAVLRGAAISGHATFEGSPPPPGSWVQAALAYEPTPWSMSRDGLLTLGDVVARQYTRADIDGSGTFELTGLESGLDYRLVVVVPGVPFLTCDAPGKEVQAPSHGVELGRSGQGAHPRLLRLQVLRGGEPVPHPRVRLSMSTQDLRHYFPRPDWMPYRGDGEGRLDLRIGEGSSTYLDISAPGLEERTVAIDPATLPADGSWTVDLEPDPRACSLRFHLESTESLEGTLVSLYAFDPRGRLDLLGPVPVLQDVALFEGIDPAYIQGTLLHRVPTTVDYDELPFVMFGNGASVRFLGLEAGEERELRVPVGSGGRIEVHLTGREASLPAPVFELVNDAGETLRAPILTRRVGGHQLAWEVPADGPFLLGQAWPAGDYVLRQVGEAYGTLAVPVPIRAREVTPLHLALTPR